MARADVEGAAGGARPLAHRWQAGLAAGARALARMLDRALDAQASRALLWLPIALAAGIGLYFQLPYAHQRWWAGVALAAAAMAGLVLRGRTGRLLLVAAAMALIGLVLAHAQAARVAAPRLGAVLPVTLVEGRVGISELRADGSRRLLLRPARVATPAGPLTLAAVRVTQARAGPPVPIGAQVRLRARLVPPPPPVRPGGYDFQRTAWFAGIGAIGTALGPVEVLEAATPRDSALAIERLRMRARATILEAVPGENGALLVALLVGDRAGLSETTMAAVKTAGLAHVIAISGFHLTVIAGAIFWLSRRLLALLPGIRGGGRAKPLAAALAALTALAYTLFTGGALPTWRACLAVCIVAGAVAIGRRPFTLRLVALGALLLLLVQPSALMNVSFQLSFLAVTALLAAEEQGLFAGVRAAPFIRALPAPLMALVDVMTATLVAELALAPLAIAHFHQQGLYGLAANLLVVPLTSFVLLPLGLTGMGLALAGGPGWLLQAAGIAGGWMLDIARTVAAWPQALQLWPAVPWAVLPLYAIGAALLGLLHGRVRWLGAVPLLGALALAATTSPPDIRIAPDGRQVALAMPDGTLAYARLPGGFTAQSWNEAAARTRQWSWNELGLAGDTPACRQQRCIGTITRADAVWRIAIDRPGAPPTCPDAHLWIVPHRRAVGQCPLPVLDARWFDREGATELWLPRAAGLPWRISTSGRLRGDHPWAKPAETPSAAQPLGE